MRIALLVVALAAALDGEASAQTVLKIATLAPEGSSWMKLSHEWQRSVEARTAGRVKVKYYAGGVQGDERDMLRKMRLGQLAGAELTAIGLAAIDSEVRALDGARTYEELDYARSVLGERLRKRFEEKGFVLLGWGDIGPIYLFSNRPVRAMEDWKHLKLWMWSDDPVTRKLLAALEVQGVPLGVPDVLPALATGQIDAFFASPLAALALQWSTHAKYATSTVMGQATGATVIYKPVWDALSAEDQKAIRDEAHAIEQRVIDQVRGDNTRALETMKVRGLAVVPTPPELERELEVRGWKVATEAGASYPQEFQDLVKQVIEHFRARPR
jgi:TRAP-type C4-dicarboxylate transport system substrate-binding protein